MRQESPRALLRRLINSVSRHPMLARKTKLRCFHCQALVPVVNVFSLTRTAALSCGHRRPLGRDINSEIARLEKEIERAKGDAA